MARLSVLLTRAAVLAALVGFASGAVAPGSSRPDAPLPATAIAFDLEDYAGPY